MSTVRPVTLPCRERFALADSTTTDRHRLCTASKIAVDGNCSRSTASVRPPHFSRSPLPSSTANAQGLLDAALLCGPSRESVFLITDCVRSRVGKTKFRHSVAQIYVPMIRTVRITADAIVCHVVFGCGRSSLPLRIGRLAYAHEHPLFHQKPH